MTLKKHDEITDARCYENGVTLTLKRAYPLAVGEQGRHMYVISRSDAQIIGEVGGLCRPGTTRTQIIPQYNFCPHCGEALK